MKVLSLSKSALKASLSVLLLTSCTPESLTAVSGLLTKLQAQQSAQSQGPLLQTQHESHRDKATTAERTIALKHNPAEHTLKTETRTEAEIKAELTGQAPPPLPSLVQQGHQEAPNEKGMAEPPPDQPAAQGCLQALIRVRFGQFELNPSARAKSWKGRLETSQGRFFQLNKIQFEVKDQLELSVDQRLISFQTQTHPHYDGFATRLQVPTGSPLPSLKFITEMGVKTLTFKELLHLNAVKSVDSTGNRIQIQAELLPPQTGACGNTSPELPELKFPGENTEVNEDSAAPTPVDSPLVEASVASSAEAKTEAQF